MIRRLSVNTSSNAIRLLLNKLANRLYRCLASSQEGLPFTRFHFNVHVSLFKEWTECLDDIFDHGMKVYPAKAPLIGLYQSEGH